VERRSIWGQIQGHTWKWRYRTRAINGIIWHATRGGQNYPGRVETQATINWFISPNNKVVSNGTTYAGMSNYIVGPNIIVEAVPPEYMPAFSSWPSDEHAISIEVAQSNLGQPIEKETIDACLVLAEELTARYNIPKIRNVYISNDWTWTGHAGHAQTVQGRYQGKTDPDNQFWDQFWPRFIQKQPQQPTPVGDVDYMTPQEFLQALQTNESLRNSFVAIVKDWLPVHYAFDANAEARLVTTILDSIRMAISEALGSEFPDVGKADPIRWIGIVTRRLDQMHDAVEKYLRGVISEQQMYQEIEKALNFRMTPPPATP